MVDRYFEDYTAGEVMRGDSLTITELMIIDFALTYDPLPMHTDVEAAKRSPAGGLIAPSLMTVVLSGRLLTKTGVLGSHYVGGAIDEMRFHRAIRPDDTIYPRVEVMDGRVSNSKPDRGIVRVRWVVDNQRGEQVLSYISTLVVLRQPV